MKIEPRPYQQRIVDKALRMFRGEYINPQSGATERPAHSVLVESPTGSGKTVMGLSIAAALQKQFGLRVGWAAMRRNLLAQAAAENVAKEFNVDMATISMFDKNPPAVDLLVVDEAQHDAAASMANMHAEVKPKYVLGLSVGGDSTVLLKHDNGRITHRRIGKFIDTVPGIADGRIVYLDGYSVRAFDGEQFVWKKLRSVIRHTPDEKKTYRIRTQRGRSLLITEDHSVYRVVENGRRNGKPLAALEEVRGDALAVGDWLLLEDSLPDTKAKVAIDFTETIRGSHWKVAGDFGSWIHANITHENGYRKAPQIRYARLRGKYGPYLNASEYKSLNPAADGLIYYGGKGNKCPTRIDAGVLAYLIGFYLGNGWTDGDRVKLSANKRQLPVLLAKLKSLEELATLSIHLENMGNSTEVHLHNKTIADWFKAKIGGRAWQKRIPSICFEMATEQVREVLLGMLDTDGHLSLNDRQGKYWYYSTTSHGLALDLIELLKRCNVVASLHKASKLQHGVIEGRALTARHIGYQVLFSGCSFDGDNNGHRGLRSHFAQDFAGHPVQIKSITEEPAEYVYDFSVDDDNWQCFVANGFLVHNTATPFRTDRIKLCFDKIITDAGIHQLIQDGYLSRYRHFTIPVYNPESVAAHYNAEPARWGKTLIFFHNLHDANYCATRLQCRAEVVTASSNRDRQLADFEAGRVDVLLSMMILTEGFDCPALKTVFCRPSGKGCTMQMCGRVFRKHADTPIKQLVQCRNTRHPFLRTAIADEQWTWDDDRWQALTVNAELEEITQTARLLVASAEVAFPSYVKTRRKPIRVFRRS